jgi:hypothetical protein
MVSEAVTAKLESTATLSDVVSNAAQQELERVIRELQELDGRSRVLVRPLIDLQQPTLGQAGGGGGSKALDESALSRLLAKTHLLTAAATELDDGRHVKVILGHVHDALGATRRGIEVQLFDASKHLIDRTLTDDGGLVLLRHAWPAAGQATGVKAYIAILGTDVTRAAPIEIPTLETLKQGVVTDLPVPSLPDLPVDADGVALPPPLGDDPLERLPSDFSPALAEAIVRLRGATKDPILGPAGGASDFRGRRVPIVKQMAVPRTGPTGQRYIVRMRQQWVFLGYTLGELKQVTPLDPGQVVRSMVSQVEKTVSSAHRATDEALHQATSLSSSLLTQLAQVDTLVKVATNNTITNSFGVGGSAGLSNPLGGLIGGVVGGVIAGPIGLIAGGILGGGASAKVQTDAGTTVTSDTNTSTRTNTSLLVNSALQTAQTAVNTAIATATQLVEDLQRQTSDATDEVSPLLSRVTNLVRWTMYENYAVVSRVEDVTAVNAYDLDLRLDAGGSKPVFSDEDIVEYQRWLEPALLDPTLRSHFDVLRQAVATRVAGGPPVTHVHVEIDYNLSFIAASCTLDLGETRVEVSLPAGSTSTRLVLAIPPTPAGQLDSLRLRLHAHWVDLQIGPFNLTESFYGQGSATIDQVRLWFDSSPAGKPDQTVAVTASDAAGGACKVDIHHPSRPAEIVLAHPPRDPDTRLDPLFRHVDRNKHHYLSVLFNAARVVPSLRVDSDQLKKIDKRLWHLPVFGFEGGQVLVLEDAQSGQGAPGSEPEFVDHLLNGDAGAATIVQLAAPGSYSEALQGLLKLDDAVGLVHPILNPPKPVLPPVALVDLDQKHLVPIDQGPGLSALAVPEVPRP